MKQTLPTVLAALFIFCIVIACEKADQITYDKQLEVTGDYINGTYEGQTSIDGEGYNALANITVNRGQISVVDWRIYDNRLKRNFDDTYEEVYTGNALYQQQCRDNMVGMRAFGPKLIETQDIGEVDNITGATWCWRKFKDVVAITLKDAYADTSLANP
jgi:major membrane immunogen (membrane-anchored lipoprotein)